MSKSIYTRSLAGLSAAALALVGLAGAAAADPAESPEPTTSDTVEAPSEESESGTEATDEAGNGNDADAETPADEATDSEGDAADEGEAGETSTTESKIGLQASTQAAPDYAALDILNITDFHGRINQAAKIATFLNQFRSENPDGTIFTSSGDNIGATTFESSSQDDKPTITVLNMMGLRVSAVGNHEFDKGWDDFVAKNATTDFTYLGANVENEVPDLPGHEVFDLNGVKVGFVGILTEDMGSLVSPDGVKGIGWGDMVEHANAQAEILTDGDEANGEADVLIALVHEGPNTPDVAAGEFSTLANGISEKYTAVFAGHTHIAYNTEHRGIQFLQSGQYGEGVGHLGLQYDKNHDVEGFYKPKVTIAGITATKSLDVTPDPEIAAYVKEVTDRAEEIGKEVIGYTAGDFLRGKNTDGSENRGSESTIGNLVAEAHLAQAKVTQENTDFAVMNPGGIRADLLYKADSDGAVTLKDAAVIQPFANSLMVVTLTGAEIKQMLEEQWQLDKDGNVPNRAFLKLGIAGFSYTYDPAAERGERITSITLDNGEPIDMAANYRVAANSFLATGGDNFHVLAGKPIQDTGQIDLDATIDYIKNTAATKDTALQPKFNQRSIGIHDVKGNLPEDLVVSGSELSLEFSSLSFSAEAVTGGKVATELTCEFSLVDGDSLGKETVAVDNTVSDGADETGKATIDLTVPDLTGREGQTIALVCSTDLGDEVTVATGKVDGTPGEEPTEQPTEEPTEQPTEDPTGTPTEPGKPGPSDPGKPSLPITGAQSDHLGIAALLLVGAGLASVGIARRQALR